MRLPWIQRGRQPARTRRKRPAWARVVSQGEWEAFLDALEEAICTRELEATRQGDAVAIRLDPTGAPVTLALRPLFQRCAGTPQGRWPHLVGEQIAAVLAGRAAAAALDRRRFEAVRERLRVRLYPESVAHADPGLRLVTAPFAEDVVAVLALDTEAALVSVPAEDAAAWGQSPESLWACAWSQSREAPAHRETVSVARGIGYEAWHGPSHLVASQAHFLGGAPGPYGRLVALPTCHLLLVHRIRDARVLLAVQDMAAQALHSYSQGPGSLSPHLYWVPGGETRLRRLPVASSRRGLRFRPPPDFVEQVITPLGGDVPKED